MFKEENYISVVRNLKTKYKQIICNTKSNRILINKENLKSTDILIKGYVDHTSAMIFKNISDENICIMKIPKSFYNYFIGKNGVMKVKHENMFQIKITEMNNYLIKVDGEDKLIFKKYVLDKIYNYIK